MPEYLDFKTICKIYHNNTMKQVDKQFLYCDVDDTLLTWPKNPLEKQEGHIPLTFRGQTYWLKPNEKNIQTLKLYSELGYTCVIWSLGGQEWAQIACNVLNLTPYIKYCLSKPQFIIDDLAVQDWMPSQRDNLFQKDED